MGADFILNVKATGTEKFAQHAKDAEQAIDKTEANAQKLASALSAAFSVAAIGKWAQATIRAAQELTDLSDRTGVARAELQALQYAADATTTPLSVLTGVFESLAQAQGEIHAGFRGSAESIKAFEKLGFTLKDLQTKSPQKLFEELARKVQEGALSSEEMAAGVRLFGENFRNFIPAARSGLADLVKGFKGGWAEIDEATLDNLDRIGAGFDKLWANVKAGAKKFSADLVSTITDGVTAILNGPLKLAGWFSKDIAEWAEEVDTQLELNRMGDDGSQEVEAMEKKLKDRKSRKTGDAIIDFTPERSRRSGATSRTGSAFSADSLARIGGFSRGQGRLDNRAETQLKLTEKMEAHLRVIKGEFTADK